MMRAATTLTAALVALPWPLWAQTTVCRTLRYCDDALACQPWDSVLEVAARPDGTATLTWDGAYPFEATVLVDATTMIVVEATKDGTASMLVVGESGEATYSTAVDFGDYLLAGFYTLTCEVP